MYKEKEIVIIVQKEFLPFLAILNPTSVNPNFTRTRFTNSIDELINLGQVQKVSRTKILDPPSLFIER